MKKYIVAIFIIIMLAGVVSAADFEIDSVKVYVDNERDSGADEDGGDFEAAPGQNIEFAVKLQNNMDNTTQAKLKLTFEDIEDGDIDKDIDWYDIDSNNDKSRTLSYSLPDDTRPDTYSVVLEIWYKFNNGTEYKFDDIDYDLDVRDIEEEEGQFDLYGAFYNMTGLCENIVTGMSDCYGYLNGSIECNDELSTCREQRGTTNANLENCLYDLNETRDDEREIDNELTNCQAQITSKENQIKTMLTTTDCEKLKQEAVNEAEKKSQNNMLMIGLLGVGVWWFMNNRKKKGSVYDTYSYEKKL